MSGCRPDTASCSTTHSDHTSAFANALAAPMVVAKQ